MATNKILVILKESLKKIPGLRRLVHDLDILFRFGSFRPNTVRLVNSNSIIYIDPREERGRALLRSGAAGQPELKKLWSLALDNLQPEAVVDVGANYGEFLFLSDYPWNCRIVAVEADPKLYKLLELSRKNHDQGNRIELHCALACAESGGVENFYIDEAWSGRSSAIPAKTGKVVEVSKVKIDDLFEAQALPKSIVFKIDVEGFEPQVIAGMETLLSEADQMVGMLEFNADFLKKTGVELVAYVRRLQTYGHLFSLRGGTFSYVNDSFLAVMKADEKFVADLILVSDLSLAHSVGLTVND